MTGYETFGAPVAGGALAGGEWRADASGPALLAVHGITASHRAWDLVAEELDDVRIVAPDLRGRGRSNALPAPYRLVDHADDLARVLDDRGIDRALVVGHSMGAFVSVRFAERHPDRVAGLVLIDGGLPLPPPAGIAPEDVPQAVLGPAVERLSMRFDTASEYIGFWRRHPGLGPYWNDAIEDYVRYDLDGVAPELRSASNADAVGVNALELDGSAGYLDALAALVPPLDFVRAERGLLDQPEPLYPSAAADDWARRLPALRVHEAPDVNHYTILMTEAGLQHITPVLRARLALASDEASITVDKEVAP
ncbi:alpha/beta hydrolase [Agromyces protaetiae]|uniref:Alpha/beta hydrolase n=1 Tax=Agromyces protaetiae TaxID=2509455 RepID=A0A4P6FKB9_9MICO|nr:alpha/beta hydrolase [Agromyces protaetiae]QAY74427.1 alpha/beta hydrolase [Agromyces protaetiae]